MREQEREIYYEELAYTIMEAEKSHDLPSANLRLIKANGIIYPKSEGPRTRVADGINPNPRAGEDKMICTN